MNLTTVTIDKPEDTNFILGQSHFIKTVEDMHEALVNTVPGIRFGLAFCEASGACLVRVAGTPVALNVDGIEKRRAKWGAFGRGVYAFSERLACVLPDAVLAAMRSAGGGRKGIPPPSSTGMMAGSTESTCPAAASVRTNARPARLAWALPHGAAALARERRRPTLMA